MRPHQVQCKLVTLSYRSKFCTPYVAMAPTAMVFKLTLERRQKIFQFYKAYFIKRSIHQQKQRRVPSCDIFRMLVHTDEIEACQLATWKKIKSDRMYVGLEARRSQLPSSHC